MFYFLSHSKKRAACGFQKVFSITSQSVGTTVRRRKVLRRLRGTVLQIIRNLRPVCGFYCTVRLEKGIYAIACCIICWMSRFARCKVLRTCTKSWKLRKHLNLWSRDKQNKKFLICNVFLDSFSFNGVKAHFCLTDYKLKQEQLHSSYLCFKFVHLVKIPTYEIESCLN